MIPKAEADGQVPIVCETALLAEAALAVDWLRLEEGAAWLHLTSDQCDCD